MKIHTLLWMSFLFLFTACDQDDDPIPRLEGNRTVLVYIVADNNGLEENYNNKNFASQDIEEMMIGMKSVDTSINNLLVYLDDNSSTPVLFRIAKDKKGNVKKEIIKEYEEHVSTDVSVMTEVFKRAFNEYPADSYGLVYWSHADGWIPYPVKSSTRWIGQDKGQGDQGMNISDFLTVLDSAPYHFDFMLFDACFMMSVEVAYELRNYTDYYVGCPTENPGPGAPYDKIVPQMFLPNAALNMATEYFNYYEGKYDGGIGLLNNNWTAGTSIAVLRTSELENLAIVTNRVLSNARAVDIGTLRRNIFNYDKRSSFVGYYDMKDLIKELTDNASFATWEQAYNSSIVYWNTTPLNYSMSIDMFSMEGTNGVAHYIPESLSSSTTTAYRSTAWYTAAGLSKLGW